MRRRVQGPLDLRVEGLCRRAGLLRVWPDLDGRTVVRAGLLASAAGGTAALAAGATPIGAGVVAFVVAIALYLVLDTVAGIVGERTRRRLLELVGMLNRWCSVREDLLYAFEKSLSAGLGEPMRSHVRDLVTRIRGGMGMERALEMFGQAADHPQFRDFVLAVRFNLRYRGDLPKFLEGMESQLGRVEEEYARRRISTARDRAVVLGVLAVVPLAAMWMLSGDVAARTLFLDTGIGSLAAQVGVGLYLAGAYVLFSTSGVRG